ncbi:MAG: global response regulator transcription factor PrrA [Rhodothalassiaceae bacterium]
MAENDDMPEEVKTLLIVDDDPPFRTRLGRAMEGLGYSVLLAGSLAEARALARAHKPRCAVLDMRLEDGNGLDLVPELRALTPSVRIVILTGYGNIASAVAAVKTGAVDYLAKPAEIEAIAAALEDRGSDAPPPPENPMSADRVRWEHIQRVYELCGRNVSETARRLNMHRRTLQRILAKRAPR